MLTFEDCLALCELSEEEIEAIVEHEHIPEVIALELGHYLCRSPDGELCLKRMILDDIAVMEEQGNLEHALKLRQVLRHFVQTHPKACGGNGSAGRVNGRQ